MKLFENALVTALGTMAISLGILAGYGLIHIINHEDRLCGCKAICATGKKCGMPGYASVTNSTFPIVLRSDTISTNWVNITGYCTDSTPANCQLGVNLSENAGRSATTERPVEHIDGMRLDPMGPAIE